MELRIAGHLFRGRFADMQGATLIINGDRWFLEDDNGAVETSEDLRTLRLNPRLGQIPRMFETANGHRFETKDFSKVDVLEGHLNGKRVLSGSKFRTPVAMLLAVLLLLSVYLLFREGIPCAASILAPYVPASVADQMSEQFERLYLRDQVITRSSLSDNARARFDQSTSELKSVFANKNIRIDLMNEKYPNAFVLPNGHIFVTTRLVEISETEDEILSVLFHEMGHQEYQHVMQNWIENSALSVLLMSITGGTDFSSIPAFVFGNVYSRDKERQADDYALFQMKLLQKDPMVLASMLKKIEAETPSMLKGIPSFLSTHPSYEERLERMKK